MKLATVRLGERTSAVRVDEGAGEAVEVSASDVGALLSLPDWRQAAERAAGTPHRLDELDYAPLVPRPTKVLCVGQNYKKHLAEQGIEAPKYPTLFAKFSTALAGAHDDLHLSTGSQATDWEVELAVVIGTAAHRVSEEKALEYVAGYAVLNDVSMRDWQYRTSQFLQGKTFDRCTPFGPWLVTGDDPDVDMSGMDLHCDIDGERLQEGNTSDLLFAVPFLVSYISHAMTLLPGDVIATGTPGGSGHWRKPPRYLAPGNVMVTGVGKLGECRNRCVLESRDES